MLGFLWRGRTHEQGVINCCKTHTVHDGTGLEAYVTALCWLSVAIYIPQGSEDKLAPLIFWVQVEETWLLTFQLNTRLDLMWQAWDTTKSAIFIKFIINYEISRYENDYQDWESLGHIHGLVTSMHISTETRVGWFWMPCFWSSVHWLE